MLTLDVSYPLALFGLVYYVSPVYQRTQSSLLLREARGECTVLVSCMAVVV